MDHPPSQPSSPPTISPLGGPHADKVRKTGFGFSLSIHGFLPEKMKFSNRRDQYACGICPCGVFHLAPLFQKHHYLRYQSEPTQPDWEAWPTTIHTVSVHLSVVTLFSAGGHPNYKTFNLIGSYLFRFCCKICCIFN